MDNAEIVARLEEVTKTLHHEKRRYGLRKSYWAKEVETARDAGWVASTLVIHTEWYNERLSKYNAASTEYDAIVARIAAVRAAIERLS